MPRIKFRQNFSDSLNMLKLYLLDRFVRFVARINCCSNTIDYPRLTLKIYSHFRLRPEGGGGKRHFFSFYICDRAAEDEQVEKNRIKIRQCIPEILHAKV